MSRIPVDMSEPLSLAPNDTTSSAALVDKRIYFGDRRNRIPAYVSGEKRSHSWTGFARIPLANSWLRWEERY